MSNVKDNPDPSPEVSCEVCHKPDDSRMVACDKCGKWYHFGCVGEDSSVADREWKCKKCLTGAVPKPKKNQLDPKMQEYMQKMLQQQMGEMQKKFESIMKEKDEQRARELIAQRKKFDQELKDSEQRVVERMQKEQQQQQQLQQQANLIGYQSSLWPLGVAANSTGYPLPNVDDEGGRGVTLEHQLKILEQQQALEKKHFEERARLMQLYSAGGGATGGGAAGGSAVGGSVAGVAGGRATGGGASGGGAAGGGAAGAGAGGGAFGGGATGGGVSDGVTGGRSGTDGGAIGSGTGSNLQGPWNDPNWSGFIVQQSQVSARQAVSKELPVFTGNPEEWPLFYASYTNSTRICGYTEEENLLRLQRCLKGKALDAVRCRLLHPGNLNGVISTLKTLFGRPEIIVHSLISKIREMPAPKAEKLTSLIDFGVAVQNVCATIEASGLDEYMCNIALLQELTERLPSAIRLN